ncbi:carboxypeptidase-like regulatory domain-containing protein [Kordia jejudonensis]|uniref:carboxypeptidase-like regulatory domain-containing protein n=1 Tax=Kordia jejudonensis TaxID=1348245 RepID=UPI0006291A00|nr:carboxypeptidase-like regulatory domain-containing protein [Kordia jejudonensis]
MKHPKITIRIPEPCHEDWNEMTPTQKGKFCNVCTKEVIDFTAESDEQIIQHFQKNDNVCGRFHTSQLDRKLIVDRKKRNHWLSYAASFLLPITLFSQEVKKNTIEKPKTEHTNATTYTSLHIGSLHKQKESITVSGIITDDTGFPLPGATIKIKGTQQGIITDFDGNYTLNVNKNDVLIVSYVGYITAEIKVTKEKINVVLQTDNSLGESQILPIPNSRLVKVNIGAVAIVTAEDIQKRNDSLAVNGTITDDAGLPLAGATVKVKNTETSVTTNFDGHYILYMKRNDTLIVNYIGYESTEIKVTKNKHDVQL